jgi:hypothetical protein
MRALPYGKAMMPAAQIRGTPMVVGRDGVPGYGHRGMSASFCRTREPFRPECARSRTAKR